MRLIDKDELIAFIKANGYVYANTLESFPEVDAVPVVRCGECKHRYSSEFCECRDKNAFCSDGERRESEVSE